MYSSRTESSPKVVFQINNDDNDKITLEQIELMKHHDTIVFTNPKFNQPIDFISDNIKYIDMSAIQLYEKPFIKFPSALIGIAFPVNLPCNNSLSDFSYLPFGIKIVYFPSRYINWDISVLISKFPPSVEYIVFYDNIYIIDITNRNVKKIIQNDFDSVKSEVIFDISFD